MTGTQYRAAIKRLGLSQRAAAKFLGVNERTSRRWAKNGPPYAVAYSLRMANWINTAATDDSKKIDFTKPIERDFKRY